MPLIDFRQARSEIELARVLELLDWQPRGRRGCQVRGACPLHGSTSPRSRSFSAHLGRGVWHCFRCGASVTEAVHKPYVAPKKKRPAFVYIIFVILVLIAILIALMRYLIAM